jgi:nitrite reductase (NO-forming)
MPNQNLTPAEIQQYLVYFHWIDAQPAGSVPAAAAH